MLRKIVQAVLSMAPGHPDVYAVCPFGCGFSGNNSEVLAHMGSCPNNQR